jgi:ADP-ribose pyrophosphatase YjhB (NUDIX family)
MTSYRPVAPELASRITSAVTAQQQLRAARTPSHDDTGASQQEHESLLRQVEDILAEHKGALQGVAIEVLYITRTIVDAAGPRDARRWSGQVAFPGGKKQGTETGLATACRECREEVALDLQSPEFVLLGCLSTRKAKADMALSAFVFLHAAGTAELRPEPHEVAGGRGCGLAIRGVRLASAPSHKRMVFGV